MFVAAARSVTIFPGRKIAMLRVRWRIVYLLVVFAVLTSFVVGYRIGKRPVPVSLNDEVNSITKKYAEEWDTIRPGLDDEDPEYVRVRTEWRWRYDAEMRAVYVRHGKDCPNHLKKSN